MLNFQDLSYQHLYYFKRYLANGFGTSEFFLNYSELLLPKNTSLEHEFDYLKGGTNKDKIIADKKYIISCFENFYKVSIPLIPLYFLFFILFYAWMSLLGFLVFEYHKPPFKTYCEMKKYYKIKKQSIFKKLLRLIIAIIRNKITPKNRFKF